MHRDARNARINLRRAAGRSAPALMVLTLILVLCSFYPLSAARDDAEKDMKGYDREMVDREKAERAVGRGKRYLEDREYDRAREQFDLALELVAGMPDARFCLGRLERLTGHAGLSEEHLLVLYDSEPDYEGLCEEMTKTQLALGECEKARLWLERARGRKDSGKRKKELDELERETGKCFDERKEGQR